MINMDSLFIPEFNLSPSNVSQMFAKVQLNLTKENTHWFNTKDVQQKLKKVCLSKHVGKTFTNKYQNDLITRKRLNSHCRQ